MNLLRLEHELLSRVERWCAATRRNVSQGRQVLRKLPGGSRVDVRPREDGTCELSGWADYGKRFSEIVATAVAASTDSRPTEESFDASIPSSRAPSCGGVERGAS